MFKYADQKKDNIGAEHVTLSTNIAINNVENDYNNFIKDYVVNQKDFMAWLDSVEIDYNIDQITNSPDWEFISKRIKAELANALWGKEYFYKTLINTDIQVEEAKKQFEFARTLLK